MIVFAIQAAFLFGIALFQISFVTLVFSSVFAHAAVAVSIAFVLTKGFQRAWLQILLLGFFMDGISFQAIGTTSLTLFIIAYTVAFVSRRVHIERNETALVFTIVFSCIASAVFPIFLFWIRVLTMRGAVTYWSEITLYASHIEWFPGIFEGVFLAAIMYGIVMKLNHFTDFYDDRVTVMR